MSAAQQAKTARTAQKDRQLLAANDAQVDQTVQLIDNILAKRNDLAGVTGMGRVGSMIRSEEQTSELQSLMRKPYAVFWLKKNNVNRTTHNNRDGKQPRNTDH